MKNLFSFLFFLLPLALSAQFVEVRGTQFYRSGQPYTLVGTNFWYGAILASEGQGGDRARLARELDLMKQTGINNVRVLVGGEGAARPVYQIKPSLQPLPAQYNDTILRGLDYLMVELERRGMTAVLYLNNSWEWSGGYGQYLEWAGAGPIPSPKDWDAFLAYHCQFVRNHRALDLAARHTRHIVGRCNTITGRPYSDSPALLAWEVANEPRAFAPDSLTKEAFAKWILAQARLIKSIDRHHLVTTGSEGLYGCENDMALFRRIHAYPEVDYATIHIWPYNWNWLGPREGTLAASRAINAPTNIVDSVDVAIAKTRQYIALHLPTMKALRKPLVLEEFGYPRDGYLTALTAPTTGRDRYFRAIVDALHHDHSLAGIAFWAWGGYAIPPHEQWQPGDPYTGDPAQEEQGINAVFATDTTTLDVLRHTQATK